MTWAPRANTGLVSLVLLPTIYTWLDVMRHWPGKMFGWLGRKLGRRRFARNL